MNREDQINQARSYFDKMPIEVKDVWLNDRVNSNGWPPFGLEWAGFLIGRPKDEWKRFEWRLDTLNLNDIELSDSSVDLINEIQKACFLKQDNLLLRYIPDTRIRFQKVIDYVGENRALPGRVILLKEDGYYSVVDGHHRMAVWLGLGELHEYNSLANTPMQAWVANV